LVAAVERADVIGALGHEFRWNPARAAVGAAIGSGALGRVRLATIVEYSAFLHNPAMSMPSWFETPGIGGWLGANGSHTLDQLRTWLGPFASVSAAMLTTSEHDRQVEDAYSVRFGMGSGTEVVLQQVGAAWTDRGFVAVTGTRGTVGIDSGEAWISDRDGTRSLDAPFGSALVGGGIAGGDLDALGGYELRHYERLGAAFRAAIEGRSIDTPVPLPTFADGLGVMRCIDAIRTSASAGGELVAVDGG
jgi:predicted dehydrogenase